MFHTAIEWAQSIAGVEEELAGGDTPLHYAALEGHVPVTKVLVQRGANVTAEAADRLWPIHWALRQGHVDVAKELAMHSNHTWATDAWLGTQSVRWTVRGRYLS